VLTPDVYSQYAVLVDLRTGKVLWERNPNKKRPMASTTKIMTAALMLEKCRLDGVVVAPVGIDKVEESSLHLTPGESITVRDLLYAMLLRSANDTAVAGAIYASGSVPAFVGEMNNKAKDLGLLNTHFVTPNGLFDKNHYSTAYDLAMIARYALTTQPEFDKIVRTQKYRLKRSIHKDDVLVKNTAYTFLREFPGADGVKTGYVKQSGHCFVGSATRKGWRLIAVALKSPKCREDVAALLNYGFANYRLVQPLHDRDNIGTIDISSAVNPVKVVAGGDAIIPIPRWKPVPEFKVRLIPDEKLPVAPIKKGAKLGIYQIMANGYIQCKGDMIAAEDVEAKPLAMIQMKTKARGNRILRACCNVTGGIMLFVLGGRIYARTRTLAKGAGGGRNRIPASFRGID
jgi:D-alanyl-D-alanine carboxypeptidase (penicillin-binding protein 5/6)